MGGTKKDADLTLEESIKIGVQVLDTLFGQDIVRKLRTMEGYRIYAERVHRGLPVTLNSAATQSGATVPDIVDLIGEHSRRVGEYPRLVQPDTPQEAEPCLRIIYGLQELYGK